MIKDTYRGDTCISLFLILLRNIIFPINYINGGDRDEGMEVASTDFQNSM